MLKRKTKESHTEVGVEVLRRNEENISEQKD